MARHLSRRSLLAGLAVAIGTGGVLSVPLAERRALAAEEAYVAERLADADCLADWGADEGAATEEATVTGVAVGGALVSVSLPYAYTVETDEGTIFADAASDAVWEVTVAGNRRVRGDEIAPC